MGENLPRRGFERRRVGFPLALRPQATQLANPTSRGDFPAGCPLAPGGTYSSDRTAQARYAQERLSGRARRWLVAASALLEPDCDEGGETRTPTTSEDVRHSLLIVEDDEATRAFLADNLAADGFRVACASGAGEGVRQIEVRHPALVLLDLALDDGSGLDLLDRVRSADGMASRIDPELPVIVLSGRGGESDRVRGFARGADDYLVKPFHYSELLARVRAVLRRANGRPQRGVVRVGDLTVDPATRAVRLAGHPVHLSAKEFALLHALAEDPTRVRSKNELLRDVWGYVSVGRTRTVDAHACRLRAKLAGTGRAWIVNVRGVGYKLTEAL
jgi:DNA-binding response OmpR family regulator